MSWNPFNRFRSKPEPPSRQQEPMGEAVFYESADDQTLPEVIGNAVLAAWETVKSGGTNGADIQVQNEDGELIHVFICPPDHFVFSVKDKPR